MKFRIGYELPVCSDRTFGHNFTLIKECEEGVHTLGCTKCNLEILNADSYTVAWRYLG